MLTETVLAYLFMALFFDSILTMFYLQLSGCLTTATWALPVTMVTMFLFTIVMLVVYARTYEIMWKTLLYFSLPIIMNQSSIILKPTHYQKIGEILF